MVDVQGYGAGHGRYIIGDRRPWGVAVSMGCRPSSLSSSLLLSCTPASPLLHPLPCDRLHVAAEMMGPADCFSLLCRTVASVTEKNSSKGNNLPLLLLFRVVMSQRNLAFTHSKMDTVALCSYMTSTYESAKLGQAQQYLADAFRVPADDLDLSARVKVCSPSVSSYCCPIVCLSYAQCLCVACRVQCATVLFTCLFPMRLTVA